MARFICALVLCLAGVAATAAPPSATAILSRSKAAQGGAAWDRVRMLRTTGRLRSSGLEGSFESLEDVTSGAFADRYDLGAIRGAQGYDGRSAWSQDSSGMARADGSEEATTAAVSEAFRRSRAFWYPERRHAAIGLAAAREESGRRFDVVTITPDGGREFELWIDAATALPDRIVQKEGPDVSTTFLSDWRDVAGLKLPFATRTTNGEAKYDTVSVAEAIEVDPDVAASAFAMPPPPPADSGFAAGVHSATLPFELLNGHPVLRVMLNGKGPLRFGFDSGGANLIVPRVAAALGVATAGAIEGRGTGEGSQDVAIAKIAQVDIGQAWMRDQTFYVFDFGELERVEGAPIDGLIGYEAFRRFIVRFDYGGNEIRLSDPAGWSYAGSARPLPFVFNEHVPQVEGSIDGIPGRFDIDTGSRSSLDLYAPFIGKHGLEARYGTGVERITGWGVGGPTRGLVARGRELRLGDISVASPVIELARAKRGSFASDFVAGNVGYGVLHRFDVTFDYAGQRLWLEPNRHYGEPDVYDRAGAWVNLAAGGDAFEIVEVVPGGPAEAAGLRAGDRITSVDGRAPRDVGVSGLRELLRGPPGTRVEVRVAGQDKIAVIVLREMV
jgi:hypothetical protein